MARRPRDGLHVWPAFSDLMSGLAVVMLLLGMREHARAVQAEADRADLRTKWQATLAELAACNEARKQYGVRQKIVEDIQARLRDKQITVSINALGNLEIAADMLFPSNGSEIPLAQLPSARTIGRALISLLQAASGSSVAMLLVVGHTDQEGPADDNLGLSNRRAASLVKLWQDDSLPAREVSRAQRCVAAKMVAAGMGESRPVILDEAAGDRSGECGNLPGDLRGCRRNRRIEIRVVPKDEAADRAGDCP
ncbi:MAG TPA: OmpA family protein [Kofleriaceae bacterium]|nr:OmpA family protein [Kofleriaceae bacterium]